MLYGPNVRTSVYLDMLLEEINIVYDYNELSESGESLTNRPFKTFDDFYPDENGYIKKNMFY